MEKRQAQSFEPAAACINEIGADCVVVTGDITHSGRRREFAVARAFFARLNAPIIGCPGNHDAPVFNPLLRVLSPISRYEALGLLSRWDSQCGEVSVRAFNSARAVQARWDWSQGVYAQRDIEKVARSFPESAMHRLLACHHPPHAAPGTAMKVGTLDAEQALWGLNGDHVLLCGHLHASAEFRAFERPHLQVYTAPTLGSARARRHARVSCVALCRNAWRPRLGLEGGDYQAEV